MLTAIRKRLAGREEGGFTLIELMVVVLIIAILIAIAIPTFLGARRRAQDRAVQSNVRNAFTAEKTHYTDAQVYTGSGTVDLEAIEPALVYVDSATIPAIAAATPAGTVAVNLVGATVYLGTRSASGTCFYLRDNPTGAGTEYSRSTACVDTNDAALVWSTNPW